MICRDDPGSLGRGTVASESVAVELAISTASFSVEITHSRSPPPTYALMNSHPLVSFEPSTR